MPEHYNIYYEPFVGGGALLLATQPGQAVIGDINEQLINMYRQIRDNPNGVFDSVSKIDAVACDKEYYYKIREDYNNKILNGVLDVECASLFIWLNKHCFNGLYRVNSKGLFNVPYNNKKRGLSASLVNLCNLSEYLSKHVAIKCTDFENVVKSAGAGDFVYFDSPYVPISDTASFVDYAKSGFSLSDHKRLVKVFRELSDKGVFCMLSNSDAPLVHELYDEFDIRVVDARRAINCDASSRRGREVIVRNYC